MMPTQVEPSPLKKYEGKNFKDIMKQDEEPPAQKEEEVP